MVCFDRVNPSESVIIAEVNADEDRVLAERFEIQGFPTLKFFPAGENVEAVDYKDERNADAMIKFVNEKAGILLGTRFISRYQCEGKGPCI